MPPEYYPSVEYYPDPIVYIDTVNGDSTTGESYMVDNTDQDIATVNPENTSVYIELENKNANISGYFGKLISNISVHNLYFPEGMKKITQADIFDSFSERSPSVTNFYIPSTVTEIDNNSFANGVCDLIEMYNGTKQSIPIEIENIILPKAGKDSATLKKLKESILKSGNFLFDHDDGNYLYFTNKNFQG